MDTLKTLRQSSPNLYPSVLAAGRAVLARPDPVPRLYAGALGATLGALPSSALYFGGYELAKRRLSSLVPARRRRQRPLRALVHALSAAGGNACSSLLFVPKEALKQRVQNTGARTSVAFAQLLKEGGVRGLYSGYRATMLRNVPSAVARFAVYEELKLVLAADPESGRVRYFLAGAAAGALSSALTTPVDVVKTQLATGKLPASAGVRGGLRLVYRRHGLGGVYAGVGARCVWSGAFSAVGFGVFEAAKRGLGVEEVDRGE
jgi:solute carrier family 25 S-adenosylmethionine transporter 26